MRLRDWLLAVPQMAACPVRGCAAPAGRDCTSGPAAPHLARAIAASTDRLESLTAMPTEGRHRFVAQGCVDPVDPAEPPVELVLEDA